MPTLTNQRSRLLGGGRLAVPVPVLGAELLTNGDFSAWSGDNPTGWTVSGESGSDPMITQVAGGARFYTSGAFFEIAKGATGSTGLWAMLAVDLATVVGGSLRANAGWASTVTFGSVGVGRCVARPVNATVALTRIGATDVTIRSVSCKLITLASMFSTRPYSTHVTVKAGATVVAGTRAGVVCNLDSASSPANFVIASHDGTTARLTKCVAGTYTELISTAVTYVSGAFVEIRRPAGGDIWQLFYGGSQVGANQTISDAAIKAATLAGMFNTYSGNTLAAFSCVPS